jgi:hypothetical protein
MKDKELEDIAWRLIAGAEGAGWCKKHSSSLRAQCEPSGKSGSADLTGGKP